MLLKCCLSHRDIDLLRYTIFCVFVSMAMHLDLFITYVIFIPLSFLFSLQLII